MNRIYRYILVHDHGIAPCPAGGTITLATCKPKIRQMAKPGDWVLGFRPGSLERGLLLWGGLVKQVMPHGEYERLHRGRPDALYRERPGGTFDRIDPRYHPAKTEMARDLSGPALIFDRDLSVYLDGQAMPLPKTLLHLSAAGRGHRVNGTKDGDIQRLEAWLSSIAASHGARQEHAEPRIGKRCS
jgi:hypothetical protein